MIWKKKNKPEIIPVFNGHFLKKKNQPLNIQTRFQIYLRVVARLERVYFVRLWDTRNRLRRNRFAREETSRVTNLIKISNFHQKKKKREHAHCATSALVFRYRYCEMSHSSLKNIKLSDFSMIITEFVFVVLKNYNQLFHSANSASRLYFTVKIWYFNCIEFPAQNRPNFSCRIADSITASWEDVKPPVFKGGVAYRKYRQNYNFLL